MNDSDRFQYEIDDELAMIEWRENVNKLINLLKEENGNI